MIPNLANLVEAAAVAWALANDVDTYDGVARKKGQALSTWKANMAFWRAYPDRSAQPIDPKDTPAVDAWLRMHVAIQDGLLKQNPPVYNASKPRWPLASPPQKWGPGGAYGARRPWKKSKPQTRYHCGVDLDADDGSPVVAPEPCTILAVDVGWEAPTKCLVMHLDSGDTLLFGGLKKGSMPAVGSHVEAGELVGRVTPYPRGDTMLHVQLYKGKLTLKQVQQQMAWYLNTDAPPLLLDPRDYLEAAMANTPLNPQNAAFAAFGESVGDPSYEAEEAEGTAEEVTEPSPTPPPPATSAGPSDMAMLGAAAAVVGIGAAVIYSRNNRGV